MSRYSLYFPVTVRNEDTGVEEVFPVSFSVKETPCDAVEVAASFGGMLADALASAAFLSRMLDKASAPPDPTDDAPTGPEPSTGQL